jgi:hypothetical protein
VDALVSDAVFPTAKKEIFLCKGLEAPPFERVGPQVCYSPFYLPLGMARELHLMQRIQKNIFG